MYASAVMIQCSSLHSDRVQNNDNLQYATVLYKVGFFKCLQYVGKCDALQVLSVTLYSMYVKNFGMRAVCMFVGPGAGVGWGEGVKCVFV
jgi:hypothetical protein